MTRISKNKRLYKSDNNKIVSGIFGGLGEYFNVDPAFLRLTWLLITVFTGFIPGMTAYFFAVFIVPKKRNKK